MEVPDSCQKRIELLAPARNRECGIEAIKHGADAVYIGAARFGARAAAGNSVEDIAELARFAHLYYARVYVTVNTILKDSELADTEALIWDLYRAGVDAILVQDMAILRMNLPSIALHASTQMDIRSVEKVRFLADCGFSRVVLARELSLDEIRNIHEACPGVELECFVHGALCVSYSGQCYASECCFGRSANRGECAQFCRLPFDLLDADGKVVVRGKHLLSLKDMCRIDSLEEMLDAGVVSFKIEGRLKEAGYVKNVTAAYSRRLDEIIARRSAANVESAPFVRISSGNVSYTFHPDVSKSFNRGFTDYFLHGRTNGIWSFDTPKSIGAPVGRVGHSGQGWLTVKGTAEFHNGDGLCYFDADGNLHGFRVNRVENGRIFLFDGGQESADIPENTPLYRNLDYEFDRTLSKESAYRRIPVSIVFRDCEGGFQVLMSDGDGNSVSVQTDFEHQTARNSQTANIRAQLSKLGGTVFAASEVSVQMSADWFVPSSLLSELRRMAVDALISKRDECRPCPERRPAMPDVQYPSERLSYLGNVMNAGARSFYHDHGVPEVADAYEKQHVKGADIMFCRHCIRFAMGWCVRNGGTPSPYREPYSLRSSDGRQFTLHFGCPHCIMTLKPE